MMDAVCFLDLDPFATEMDDPLGELYQDLVHRLIEEPGSNPDDVDRGVGITDRLSGAYSPAIAREVELDFAKDERVQACSCTVVEGAKAGSYDVEIQVVATAGTFAMAFTYDGQGNLVPIAPGGLLPASTAF
jgi:hypothetical protein